MRKFTFSFKSLLLAAGLLVGSANAWATDVNATLVHTASTWCGAKVADVYSAGVANLYVKNAGGYVFAQGSVDGATETYKNEGSAQNQGYAFAEFSFAIPVGESITSATLTWTATADASGTRTHKVYALNAGQTLDYAQIAANDAAADNEAVLLRKNGVKTSTLYSESWNSTHTIETDVTSIVTTIAESQNYIIFQWTSSQTATFRLAGKGDAEKAPTLVITTSSAALYTATFTANSGAVSPKVNIYSDSERTSSVLNGTLLDGTTYYYTASADGYVNYNGSFTVDGSDPAVAFDMTAKSVFSYTVNAVDESSNILYQITSGTAYEDDNVTFAYDAFYLKNGSLLKADGYNDEKKQYNCTFAVDTDNKVQNIVYKATSYSNVVFYKECEDIATLTATNGGNVGVRCSGSYGGYAASDAVITTLPAGTYTITSFAYGGAGSPLYIYAGETQVASFETASSTVKVTTSGEFTLDDTTDIIFKRGGNGGSSPKVLDFIFIQGTPDNEIVGAFDYSTAFLGAKKDYILTQGQYLTLIFKNHGLNTQNYYNWIVRMNNATTGWQTLRADNVVLEPGDVYTKSLTKNGDPMENTPAFWSEFRADMENSEVSMTIDYASDGMINVIVDAMGIESGNWYQHSYAYNTAVSGNLSVEVGVEKAWLEIIDSASTVDKITNATLDGWKTFYNADFNFEVDAKTTIYIASTPTSGDENVVLTPVEGKIIPAGQPVVLKTSNTSSYSIGLFSTTSDSSDDFSANGLQVASSPGTVAGAYILAYTTANGLGFYPFTGSLDAGDVYLTVSSPAKMLRIVVDGQATGIEAPAVAEAEEDGVLYNTAGQQVTAEYKGIVIKNGKKVYNK